MKLGIGSLFSGLDETMHCLNTTFGVEHYYFHEKRSQGGPCHEYQLTCSTRREDAEPKCKRLETACECAVAGHFSKARHPTFEGGLRRCCQQVLGGHSAGSVKDLYDCDRFVHNSTRLLGEFVEACG